MKMQGRAELIGQFLQIRHYPTANITHQFATSHPRNIVTWVALLIPITLVTLINPVTLENLKKPGQTGHPSHPDHFGHPDHPGP